MIGKSTNICGRTNCAVGNMLGNVVGNCCREMLSDLWCGPFVWKNMVGKRLDRKWKDVLWRMWDEKKEFETHFRGIVLPRNVRK